MHQNRPAAGLRPDPLGSLQRSPDPLEGVREPPHGGGGGKWGKKRRKRERKGREKREEGEEEGRGFP